jgi:ribosomal protein S18 acetylase RimI-like enzyme
VEPAGKPAGLRAQRGAVELYRRHGFEIVDRSPVVPHEAIRYTGEVLLMTATAE